MASQADSAARHGPWSWPLADSMNIARAYPSSALKSISAQLHLAKSRLAAAVQSSGWGQSLAPARAAVPGPAAASSRSRSHPAQHSGDLLVVPPQEFDLLLQILGRRFGPPELRLQVLDRFFEPLHPLLQFADPLRVAPRLLLKYNIRAVRALGSAWSDLAGLDEVVEGGAGDVEYLGDGDLGCSQGPLGPAEQFPLGFGSGESFLGPF